MTTGPAALYASAGKQLVHFELDPAQAALVPRGTVALPENVQYARAHPSRRTLYVASSNGVDGDRHAVTAFGIDPVAGALSQQGAPVALPHRPIHITLDANGAFLLLAANKPRTVMVLRLAADGAIGPMVAQPTAPDGGFFVHQVRVAPGNRTVLTCALGANPSASAPERLGQITSFAFANGVLTQRQAIVPGPGIGPRDLDFHPTLPLVYVALKRSNTLAVYRRDSDALGTTPIFAKRTLGDPASPRLPQQRAGAIFVHPQGGFVYVTNRSDAVETATIGGAPRPVLAGGENNVAVFAVDRASGEPTSIQHADTRGFEPRSFAIDPGGRCLAVANQKAMAVRSGAAIAEAKPNLALFGIGAGGKLEFVLTHDMAQGGDAFWVGMVGLAA